MLSNLRHEFVAFAVENGVLLFGDYTTKAGRRSPYFFNAGLFNSGAALDHLARFYAMTLVEAERRDGVRYDMLFGPAYKGITLASATAVALSRMTPEAGGRDMAFAYNRKEAKDHGEGGALVGSKLRGQVIIVDDVISAGTSVRAAVEIIRAAGATPAAVLVALDRMERGGTAENVSELSSAEEIRRDHGLPLIAIADLEDVIEYLKTSNTTALSRYVPAIDSYRALYGAAA